MAREQGKRLHLFTAWWAHKMCCYDCRETPRRCDNGETLYAAWFNCMMDDFDV
jgi:hypothetical protein